MIKVIYILIISAIIFTNNTDLMSNQTIKYFRHIITEGSKPVIGKYQINEKDIKDVNYYRLSFNDEGKVTKVEFFKDGKLHRNPQLAGVGAARILIEHLPDGSKISYENEFGEQVPNIKGVHILQREIDRNKNYLLITNFNKEGKPVPDSSGAFKYLIKFDNDGFPLKKHFLNEMGDTIIGSLGRYEIQYKYDNNNNLIEEANYGKDGKLFEDAIGCAVYKFKHDIYGYYSEMKCCNTSGQLKENIKDGYCMIVLVHDGKGNLTKADYLNLSGNTIMRIIYNANWEISEMLYHISHPAENKLTHACIDYIHYGLGPHESLAEIKYFNNKEQLKERCDMGVAIERYKRDTAGNVIECSFFNAQECLQECLDTGIAIMRFKHDKYGNIIERSTYGTEGELKTGINDNFSTVRSKYNNLGYETERRFFGADDEPVEDREDGVAIMRWEYDKQGNKTKMIGFDKNENILFEKDL